MGTLRDYSFLQDLADQVRRCNAAPAFLQALHEARQSFFVSWVNSRDAAEREKLYAELQGLIRLQAALQTILNRAEGAKRGREKTGR